jgi:hypothetical protein
MSERKSIYARNFELHNGVCGVTFKHIYEKFVSLRRVDLIANKGGGGLS